jgi:hypothetical protein
VLYALTSFIGGHVSGSMYASMDGRSWMRAMALSAGAAAVCFIFLQQRARSSHQMHAAPPTPNPFQAI